MSLPQKKKPKRKRSGLEWVWFIPLFVAEYFPWMAFLIGWVVGVLMGLCGNEMTPLFNRVW